MATPRRRLGCLLAAPLATVLLAPPAHASFPGRNGRLLVYTTPKGGCCSLFSMRPDGTGARALVRLTTTFVPREGSWSPAGSTVVLRRSVANAPGAPEQIWRVNANGMGLRRAFADPGFKDFDPSYSPDGSRILFSRCRLDVSACAVARIDADGRHLTMVTAFHTGTKDILRARYSPDGRMIAFTSNGRGGVPSAVYVMDANGTRIRRLTAPAQNAGLPDWSPDGRRVVFVAGAFESGASLWTIHPDGSGLTRLTHPGRRQDVYPVYAPAGDTIAFERTGRDFFDRHYQVWLMNADGTNPHPLPNRLGIGVGTDSWAAAR